MIKVKVPVNNNFNSCMLLHWVVVLLYVKWPSEALSSLCW